jgi:hypothetical protein
LGLRDLKEEDGMVQIITKHSIDDMLLHPDIYVDEYEDIVLLKVFGKDVSNPTILMLGYDDKRDSYYFVVEDDEVSEDIYCEKENLAEMFDIITDKLLKGEM